MTGKSDLEELADRLTHYAELMDAGLFVENVGGFTSDLTQAADLLRYYAPGPQLEQK